jgi:hypothetical protein
VGVTHDQILAALREIRRRQAEQDAQFAQLQTVVENLGPVMQEWRNDGAKIRALLTDLEYALGVDPGRPGLFQRLRARWLKTAVREPAGE